MPLYTILLVTMESIYKFQDDNASTRARKRARTYARTHAQMDGQPENIMPYLYWMVGSIVIGF